MTLNFEFVGQKIFKKMIYFVLTQKRTAIKKLKGVSIFETKKNVNFEFELRFGANLLYGTTNGMPPLSLLKNENFSKKSRI